jgi:hypothetical protein
MLTMKHRLKIPLLFLFTLSLNLNCEASTYPCLEPSFLSPSRKVTKTTFLLELRGGGQEDGGGGGWLFGWGRRDSTKNSEKRYRQELEDQLVVLERQLRAARDEATQLRKLAKLSRPSVAASLRSEIKMLQDQILQLENFQQELQRLLQQEKDLVQSLQEQLIQAGVDAKQLQADHAAAMEELEHKMLVQSQKQWENFHRNLEQRIAEAASRARQEALEEMDRTVKAAVQSAEAKFYLQLEAERQKSVQAVEIERVKMRKLVKALADREQKQQQQQQQQTKSKATNKKSGSSSSSTSTTTIAAQSSRSGQKPTIATVRKGSITKP